MSDSNSLVGHCRRCGGTLHFPAELAGTLGDCPLCGEPTGLIPDEPKPSSSPLIKALIAIWLLVVVGLAVLFYCRAVSKQGTAASLPPTTTTAATKPTPGTLEPTSDITALPKPKIREMETNEFGISPLKLEKTAGSSLVYVTGRVRNLTNLPRYGVKIEFDLADSKGISVGKAKDYIQLIDPHGVWHFRALVLESKAVAAHFTSIQESQ